MASTLFREATIVDPRSPYHQQVVDLMVDEGKIVSVSAPGELSSSEKVATVKQKGLHLSPGWIDMQVTLNDPGFEWKEDLTALGHSVARGGFCAAVCYPNTLPVVDNSTAVAALRSRSRDLPARLLFTGALTEGASGKALAELYDMHVAGACAFTDGHHPVQTAGVFLKGLQYLRAFDGLMIHYPMDQSLAMGAMINEGSQATALGMKGIPEVAESSMLARDLQLWMYVQGRLHIQPLTSPQALQTLEPFLAENPQLTIGTTLPYLVFSDSLLASFDPLYKVTPPLRSTDQVTRLKKALASGLIYTLGSGHQAQSLEEKHLDFSQAESGIHMLQTFFPLAMEHLVKPGTISLNTLIQLISIQPRKILKQAPSVIDVGQEVELTAFCPEKEWMLSASILPSRAKNSPLIGQTLEGWVVGILVKGEFYPNPA